MISGDTEKVKMFLQDNGVRVDKIQKVSHENAKFNSYKVDISKSDVEKVFNELFWPVGVHCKMWRERVDEASGDGGRDHYKRNTGNRNNVQLVSLGADDDNFENGNDRHSES